MKMTVDYCIVSALTVACGGGGIYASRPQRAKKGLRSSRDTGARHELCCGVEGGGETATYVTRDLSHDYYF